MRVPLVLFFWIASSIASLTQVTNVFLAGEFKDWNPTNALWQMTAITNGVYRTERFFQQGSYPFKFTTDGNWRGVNSRGALVTGGDNIKLAIPRHGVFAITLDLNEGRWFLRESKPTQPHAVLLVRGVPDAGLPVVLDGSESVPRVGRTIGEYEFGQDTNDAVQVKLPGEPAPTRTVTLPREGTYRFWLRVNDGLASEPVNVTAKAQRSYQVVGDWTAAEPTKPVTFMERTGAGVYEKWLRSDKPGERQLLLLRNHDAGDLVQFLSVSVTQTNIQYWHVRYDEADGSFTCTPEPLTEFIFHPPDYVVLEEIGRAHV